MVHGVDLSDPSLSLIGMGISNASFPTAQMDGSRGLPSF